MGLALLSWLFTMTMHIPYTMYNTLYRISCDNNSPNMNGNGYDNIHAAFVAFMDIEQCWLATIGLFIPGIYLLFMDCNELLDNIQGNCRLSRW